LCFGQQLAGNVEITTKGVSLQSDEVDYHCNTGEIEPRGNVRFRAFPQQYWHVSVVPLLV